MTKTERKRVGEIKEHTKRDYTQTSMSLLWGFCFFLSLSLFFSLRPNEEEKPKVPSWNNSFFCFPDANKNKKELRERQKLFQKKKICFFISLKKPTIFLLSLHVYKRVWVCVCMYRFYFCLEMGKSVHALILRLHFLYMAMPLQL